VIVADTNLIAYFVVAGSLTSAAEAVFDKDPKWIAPPLWRSELRNVLWRYVQAGQTTWPAALAAMTRAESMMDPGDFGVESAPVLTLAGTSGCSPYDCEFVHVAQASGCPLVTNDRKVLQSFPGIAVSLEDFVR
jgi:predicted nucleic acid-binding protein